MWKPHSADDFPSMSMRIEGCSLELLFGVLTSAVETVMGVVLEAVVVEGVKQTWILLKSKPSPSPSAFVNASLIVQIWKNRSSLSVVVDDFVELSRVRSVGVS
jgi:hypothetical protein